MKILKSIYKLILLISVIFLSTAAISSENQLNDYYKTIRCLVCDGQSIQESDTEFAINLKEQIKKKFDNGITLKEINKELVSIYGEKISFTPSKNHIFLWMCPVIILIIFISGYGSQGNLRMARRVLETARDAGESGFTLLTPPISLPSLGPGPCMDCPISTHPLKCCEARNPLLSGRRETEGGVNFLRPSVPLFQAYPNLRPMQNHPSTGFYWNATGFGPDGNCVTGLLPLWLVIDPTMPIWLKTPTMRGPCSRLGG